MALIRLLDRLDAWKADFGQGDTGRLEKLLTAAAKWRLCTPTEAIRFHETLLFLRAYPRTPRVARLADQLLFHFADRIERMPSAGADMEPFEAPEVSGIAGPSMGAVFSFDIASSLAARHPRRIDIGWDRCDEMEKFGPVLARILPLFAEDWPTEAHVPFRDWIAAARPPRTTDLAWLLQQLAALPLSAGERSKVYGSLDLPLAWEIGNSPVSRSRLRLPGRKLFVHREPLIRRGELLQQPGEIGGARRARGGDPVAERNVGFGRPIFTEQREDAGQNGAEFFHLIAAVPADIDAAGMAGGEAGGDAKAENGAQRGNGDARDFGSFERFHLRAGGWHPRDAVREVEEKLVGESGDPRASRIGPEEE